MIVENKIFANNLVKYKINENYIFDISHPTPPPHKYWTIYDNFKLSGQYLVRYNQSIFLY